MFKTKLNVPETANWDNTGFSEMLQDALLNGYTKLETADGSNYTINSTNSVTSIPKKPDVNLLETTDAMVWAKYFMEHIVDKGKEVDEDILIAYFANAFCAKEGELVRMAPYVEGEYRHTNDPSRKDSEFISLTHKDGKQVLVRKSLIAAVIPERKETEAVIVLDLPEHAGYNLFVAESVEKIHGML